VVGYRVQWFTAFVILYNHLSADDKTLSYNKSDVRSHLTPYIILQPVHCAHTHAACAMINR
jgi:hypothetical protein